MLVGRGSGWLVGCWLVAAGADHPVDAAVSVTVGGPVVSGVFVAMACVVADHAVGGHWLVRSILVGVISNVSEQPGQ